MESNGKRVALDGTPLLHESGEIMFGEPGTTGQHSFYQLLHQGRVVPADFIGFIESQQPVDFPDEAVSNHDELMSNFFAQPDALAYGKTLVDLIQEGVPEPLREHMVFAGNRPSSSILMSKLDVFAVGQLLALYEHRAAVQGKRRESEVTRACHCFVLLVSLLTCQLKFRCRLSISML